MRDVAEIRSDVKDIRRELLGEVGSDYPGVRSILSGHDGRLKSLESSRRTRNRFFNGFFAAIGTAIGAWFGHQSGGSS